MYRPEPDFDRGNDPEGFSSWLPPGCYSQFFSWPAPQAPEEELMLWGAVDSRSLLMFILPNVGSTRGRAKVHALQGY